MKPLLGFTVDKNTVAIMEKNNEAAIGEFKKMHADPGYTDNSEPKETDPKHSGSEWFKPGPPQKTS